MFFKSIFWRNNVSICFFPCENHHVFLKRKASHCDLKRFFWARPKKVMMSMSLTSSILKRRCRLLHDFRGLHPVCFFFDPSHRVKIGNTPDLEGCPVDMKMEVLHKQFLESYCSPVWSKNSSSPFLPEYRIMEVKNGRSSTSNYLSYTAFFYFHDSGRESNHGSNREVIAWCDIMSALLTRVASCPCWFLISSSSRLDWAWKIH